MLRPTFIVVALCGLLWGCAVPEGPAAEDGAAYLGLTPGTTLRYDVGNGVTETQDMKDSGFLFAGGLPVDVFARQGGFIKDERSLTFGIDIEQVSLVRFFDCLARCGTLDGPIPFLSWPLNDGQSTEGEATVTVSAGETSTLHIENHSTAVSGPQEITVAGGTFDAFLIAWTRTSTAVDGAVVTDDALLHLAPGVGVVKHETFDGSVLELAAAP